MVADVRDLARTHTATAIACLVDVMTNLDAPFTARIAAATAVLDRGFGRPTVQVDVSEAGDSTSMIDELKSVVASSSRQIATFMAVTPSGGEFSDRGDRPLDPLKG